MRFCLFSNNNTSLPDIFKAKLVAKARVTGSALYNKVWGDVLFYNLPQGVVVVTEMHNLPKTTTNIFAQHIHSGEICEGDFESAKGHYNPLNQPHPNHAGDLPPLFSNDGYAFGAVLTNRFKIEDVENLTFIIHNSPDDFKTQPAGDAGVRIACGIIKLV
ncbi:MAG: superoxide dismutase family protein [Clostridia bacterium]|nr:superoxide dismutase family protein [Clostridia bacterium]